MEFARDEVQSHPRVLAENWDILGRILEIYAAEAHTAISRLIEASSTMAHRPTSSAQIFGVSHQRPSSSTHQCHYLANSHVTIVPPLSVLQPHSRKSPLTARFYQQVQAAQTAV
jgi:hypothetical protein